MNRSILICCLLFTAVAGAQDNFIVFVQPQLSLKYRVSRNYEQEFTLENRNFLFKDSGWDARVKHVEFSHLSRYEYKYGRSFGVGLRYRFEGNFQSSRENEFRVLQQYTWKSNTARFAIKQRLRNEQRIFSSGTLYRFRYEFGLVFPIGELLNTDMVLTAATESLLEVAHTQKPEWEQRLSLVFAGQLSVHTALKIGTQYRLGNYTQWEGHELFLLAGLAVEL